MAQYISAAAVHGDRIDVNQYIFVELDPKEVQIMQ